MEELGLVGSQAYAWQALVNGEELVAALNQDMIGYADPRPGTHNITQGFRDRAPDAAAWIEQHDRKGDFVMIFTNEQSGPLGDHWRSVAERYVPQLPHVQLVYDAAISDHAGFWMAGYDGILLFDGAGWRTPYYHTPGDTIGTLDFDFMANTARVTAIAAAELAGPLHAGADESEPFTLLPSSVGETESPIAELEIIPNPARSATTVRLMLGSPEQVSVTLYDASGRVVAVVSDGWRGAGAHHVRVDTRAAGLNPGVYLIRVVAGASVKTARLVMVQ
jgi:hypothetical protein